MRSLLLLIGIAFLLFNVWMIGRASLTFLQPEFDRGFLRGRESYFYGVYQWGLYAHIFSAPWTILIGLLQFWPKVRREWAGVHKWLGRIYVGLILLFAAPGGLIMGWKAIGGMGASLSFVLLAIVWWGSSFMAWREARRGRWAAHRRWMIRSYLLSLSAISLRFLSFLFALGDVSGTTSYILIAWLSWLPQLLIGEICLLTSRQRPFYMGEHPS
ncbi:MAG: DUF2306 domain-containing protein [Bacteroidota bacterium]